MAIEVELPDGGIAEFPDGMAPDAIKGVLAKKYGGGAPQIDFNRSADQVRADIGKLPEAQRDKALRGWADAFVANERKQGGWGQTVDDMVRTLSRGTFVGPFLDELNAITASAQHTIGMGGAPYDEALAYQRAKDRAFDKENPALSVTGRIAGGLAGGVGAAVSGGGALAAAAGGPLATLQPAATLPRQMVQGAGVGSAYGTVASFGEGEGGFENRAARVGDAATFGAGIGAALPPVVAGIGRGLTEAGAAISPHVARLQAWRNQPTPTPGARVGMTPLDDVPTPGPASTAGADAAAEQMIANQLMRANVPASRLRQQMDEAEQAALFYGGGASGSRAQNVLAPVDLDESLQRLAGSAGRQQPEAANIMQSFQSARQTGQTPRVAMAEGAGLPTRPALARPAPGDKPMGQFERVRDALKRALVIKDEDFHGHAANAYRTEQGILQAARAEAQELYDDAYKAAGNFDVRAVIDPVMQRWTQRMGDEPAAVAGAIRGAMRQFMTANGPVTDLRRFDKAKQYLDGRIEKLFDSVEGRNRYLGGVLTEFKNDMLKAIDDVKPQGIGEKYAAARAAFSSRMEAREALQLGQKVFREDADVAADQFKQLASPGLQKLFRLGMLDGFEKHMGRQKRTADVTQVFDNPRIQEILQTVIPRTETATGRAKAGATFADRPERFGRYLGNEKAMVGTRNEVFGNSKTAQRMADDSSFETLSTVVEQFRQSPSIVNVGLKAMEAMMNRMFGMRADTAASIARMLFTADPARRAQVIAAIEARMGPTRAAQLADMMTQYHRQLTQAATITGAGASQ